MTTTAREVELKDLVLEHAMWANPRTTTGLNDSDIDELADQIKIRGVLQPLGVLQVKDGDTIINLVVDGQRRVMACRKVFKPTAPIPVVDVEDHPIELDWNKSDRVMLDQIAAAVHRSELSSFELSDVAERLRNRGKTLADIASAINRSESWVSRMLTARSKADAKLMTAWKSGKLTDEQFKDLADVKPEKQQDALSDTIETRKRDKGEARAKVKEAKAKSKAVKNGVHKPEQRDLFKGGDDKPKKAAPPRKEFLEELVALSTKRAPTSDYVRGIFDGVEYSLGSKQLEEFGSAWLKYVNRVGGSASSHFAPVAKKAPKKSKAKARAPKKSKKR